MRDIERLEKNNDLKINIFRLNETLSNIFPYKMSHYKIKDGDADEESRTIDILQLLDSKKVGFSHFCWLKNLHRALKMQVSPTNAFKLCRRCLYRCVSVIKFDRHVELCKNHKIQAVSLPRKNCPKKSDIFSYIHGDESGVTEKECRAPWVMYSDIEAILTPVSLSENEKTAKTSIVNRHEPSAMSYIVTR
jgi:hypothetical protein